MKIPVKNGEITPLQFMFYLRVALDTSSFASELVERMEAVGVLDTINKAHDDIDRAFWKLHDTLPADIMRKFDNLTRDQSVVIKGRSVGQREATTTVPTDALRSMLELLQREKCKDCLGYENDMKKCRQLRKAFNGLMFFDTKSEEKKTGVCYFREMDWRG